MMVPKQHSICVGLISLILVVASGEPKESNAQSPPGDSPSASPGDSPNASVMRAYQAELARLDKTIEVLSQQRKTAEQRVREFEASRNQSFEVELKHGISLESSMEILATLQARRVALLIDIAGLTARQAALKKLQSKKTLPPSDTIQLLEKLIGLQEQRLANANQRYEKGSLAQWELADEQVKLYELKIRLAREMANQKDAFSPFITDRLQKSSLELAEKRARLEQTESLAKQFSEIRRILLDLDYQSSRLENARSNLDQIDASMWELERKRDATQAELEQLGQLIDGD